MVEKYGTATSLDVVHLALNALSSVLITASGFALDKASEPNTGHLRKTNVNAFHTYLPEAMLQQLFLLFEYLEYAI